MIVAGNSSLAAVFWRSGSAMLAAGASVNSFNQARVSALAAGVSSSRLASRICGMSFTRAPQLRPDGGRNRLVLTAQCDASSHHQSLKIQPCPAARQRHGAFCRFQKFGPLLAECQPLYVLTKFCGWSFEKAESESWDEARSSPQRSPRIIRYGAGLCGSRLRSCAAALGNSRQCFPGDLQVRNWPMG